MYFKSLFDMPNHKKLLFMWVTSHTWLESVWEPAPFLQNVLLFYAAVSTAIWHIRQVEVCPFHLKLNSGWRVSSTFCSILYQFRRCSSDFQTKTKSIDERDFWRDSLFYWSKKRSLFKSLSSILFLVRDFWRDSLFLLQ